MTEQSKSDGVTNPNPSGTSGNNQENSNNSTNHLDGYVPKDHADKILAEKKKLNERVKELEAKDREREELVLKENNKWKEFAELKEKEFKSKEVELLEMKKSIETRTKLESFLGSIGSKVDAKYWDLINLDKIVLNPESGEPDQMSVARYVEDFRKMFPEVVINANAPKLPSNAPTSTDGSISYNEWVLMSQDKKVNSKQLKEAWLKVKDK